MGKFRHCLIELSACDTIVAGCYNLTFDLYVFQLTRIQCKMPGSEVDGFMLRKRRK